MRTINILDNTGRVLASTETHQKAGDFAIEYLRDNPPAPYVVANDTLPGTVYAFTRYTRGMFPPVVLIGTPFKTFEEVRA